MTIEYNKVVTIAYEMKTSEDGQIMDCRDAEMPLVFWFGNGDLLKGFEDKLQGLGVGDKFKFQLQPQEAYGEIKDNFIIDIPDSSFEKDGVADLSKLVIGQDLQIEDAHGARYRGVIVKIEEKSVKVDFNHPMAGKTLFFSGEIMDVRHVTDEEILRGSLEPEGDGCQCCGSHGDCHDKSCK